MTDELPDDEAPDDLAPLPPLLATSPVADRLAAEIAPGLVAALQARRPELLAAAGVMAPVVRLAWRFVVRLVPVLTASAVAAVLDRFGPMTVAELAALLAGHDGARVRPAP